MVEKEVRVLCVRVCIDPPVKDARQHEEQVGFEAPVCTKARLITSGSGVDTSTSRTRNYRTIVQPNRLIVHNPDCRT